MAMIPLLLPYWLKIFGVALILTGIPTVILDTSQGAELPLLVGLFFTFMSREKIEDERTFQFRFTALMYSFFFSYVIEEVATYLHQKGWINVYFFHPRFFIIAVFTLALIIFYTLLYWTTMNHQERKDEKYY